VCPSSSRSVRVRARNQTRPPNDTRFRWYKNVAAKRYLSATTQECMRAYAQRNANNARMYVSRWGLGLMLITTTLTILTSARRAGDKAVGGVEREIDMANSHYLV
jgi:hypothetical protein